MQNTKEIDFSTAAAKLKVCLIFTESRAEKVSDQTVYSLFGQVTKCQIRH